MLVQMAGSLADTPLTFVDTLAKLEALKEDLVGVAEFAIDLEVCFVVFYQLGDPLPGLYVC